jgi:NTP pyrophosphatase (non-canonical NTP hydrolase)
MPDVRPVTALQAEIQAYADAQWGGEYWPPLVNLARLSEELGEVARAVNQRDGAKRLKPGETASDLTEELSDLLFVLLVLANSLQVDLQAGYDGTLAKVRRRDLGQE